jgi:hypothetical protein
LKLICDDLLPSFAFKFNLRRYNLVSRPAASAAVLGATDKYQAGLHSHGLQFHQDNFIHRRPPPPH